LGIDTNEAESKFSGDAKSCDASDRPIKALSAEQIADLKAGQGLSLALAAELNGYPGPRHVLELGKQLGETACIGIF
jgi:hypothetical protein